MNRRLFWPLIGALVQIVYNKLVKCQKGVDLGRTTFLLFPSTQCRYSSVWSQISGNIPPQCQPHSANRPQLIQSQWLVTREEAAGVEDGDERRRRGAISVLVVQFDNNVQFLPESKISLLGGFYIRREAGCFVCSAALFIYLGVKWLSQLERFHSRNTHKGPFFHMKFNIFLNHTSCKKRVRDVLYLNVRTNSPKQDSKIILMWNSFTRRSRMLYAACFFSIFHICD